MALISLHEITTEMLKEALEAVTLPPWWHGWFEPGHQFVRYDAKLGCARYELPSHFYLNPEGPSPSDCHWMIPCGVGALEQESIYAR
jgi:hypothetical protein